MKLFIPITKVDAVKRLVYGVAAIEQLDKSGEIFDYESSKPNFERWSASVQKASGGKSLGNVRAMHGKIAAGKLEQIGFDDVGKQIDVCAKVVDENEWVKVEEGVYTGFSVGGKYEKRWKDGDAFRYTADPSEISIVDNPCMPDATFAYIKADGANELRKFKESPMITNDQVAEKARELAKTAGAEANWASFIEAARGELEKSAKAPETPVVEVTKTADEVKAEDLAKKAAETPNSPSPDLEQVWKAKDGQTFSKKAEAIAHNEELAKKADVPQAAADLTKAVEGLTGAVTKAEAPKTETPKTTEPAADLSKANVDGDDPTYWMAKKDYSTDKRKEMSGNGQAMADGSYPIADKGDLKDAIQAFGRAKNKAATKRHIKARAKALGAEDMLPEDWSKLAEAGKLQKSLYSVGRLACMIEDLESLTMCQEYEEASEADDASSLPQRMKAAVAVLAAILRNMVVEETNELFDGAEMAEHQDTLEAMNRNRGVDALAKVLGDVHKDILAKVGKRHSAKDQTLLNKAYSTMKSLGAYSMAKFDEAEFAKVAMRHSRIDQEHLNKAYDHLASAGAEEEKDAPNGGIMDGKVDAGSDLAKAFDAEKVKTAALEKVISDAIPVINALKDRVEKLEAQPMPRPHELNNGGTASVKVVEKTADDDNLARLHELSQTEGGRDALAGALIKLAHQNPIRMGALPRG